MENLFVDPVCLLPTLLWRRLLRLAEERGEAGLFGEQWWDLRQ
jgi:hypothetical protein